jgi:methyl-accepting chemotaxis protein
MVFPKTHNTITIPTDMTIGTKLYLGFGVLILVLASVVGVGLFEVGQINRGLRIVEYFGIISDNVNLAIGSGERARTASALHIYAKSAEASKSVSEQIAAVTKHAGDAVKSIEEDPYFPPKSHEDILDKARSVLQVTEAYNKLDKDYADLQGQRNEKSEAFNSKYAQTGVILGEILKTVDEPYQQRVKDASTEGEVPLLYFKRNKVTRDCRGALTAFKIAYDTYQLAIGETEGKKTHDAFWDKYNVYVATIKAFDTVPFDEKQVERIKQIREIADTMKTDLLKIAETTNTQNRFVTERIDKEQLFNTQMKEFLDDVDEIYTAAEDTGKEAVRRASIIIFVFGSAAFVLAVVIACGVVQNVVPGIKSVAQQMTQIADTGDLSVEVESRFKKRRDEIGDLANSFAHLTSEFRDVENLAKHLAAGNWKATVEARSESDVMNIHLSQMLDQVNELLCEVGNVVEKVSDGTMQLEEASCDLSQGATESAASIEEISESVTKIGVQTQETVSNADSANHLAQKASTAAATGQEMMEKMVASMQQITANANDVQRVIKVIDDISFQTNLLALNAAVEAARAGTHGKGFAVVAEEVRNLAARSAKAAAETSQMITNNNKQIQNGADIVSQTAETLVAIVDQAKQVADLIEGIATANKEQAHAVSLVSQGLQKIETVTQQNSSNAEQTAGTSNEMSSRVKQLQEILSKFRLREKPRD